MLRYNYVIFAALHLKQKKLCQSENGINKRRPTHSCIDEVFLLCGKRKKEQDEVKKWRRKNMCKNERERTNGKEATEKAQEKKNDSNVSK